MPFCCKSLVCSLFGALGRFQDAVTGLLAQDPQSDLTYMIADYMSYSTRINRSCVVLGAGRQSQPAQSVRAFSVLSSQ